MTGPNTYGTFKRETWTMKEERKVINLTSIEYGNTCSFRDEKACPSNKYFVNVIVVFVNILSFTFC